MVCCNQGQRGPQGIQGSQGIIGQYGSQGWTGPNGPQGSRGVQGKSGGDQGWTGPIGLVGPPGGDQGWTGPDGVDGSDGATGAVGTTGAAGADGSDGAAGDQGWTGPAGNLNDGNVDGQVLVWDDVASDWIITDPNSIHLGTLSSGAYSVVVVPTGTSSKSVYPQQSVLIGNEVVDSSTTLDHFNVVIGALAGDASTILGYQNVVVGASAMRGTHKSGVKFNGSTLIGYGSGSNNANMGDYAVAIGHSSGANLGDNSVVIGVSNGASGENSVAIGRNSDAPTDNSVGLGYLSAPWSTSSTAIGHSSKVWLDDGVWTGSVEIGGVAIGHQTDSIGSGVSIGFNVDTKLCPVAVGIGNNITANNGIAIGEFLTIPTGPNQILVGSGSSTLGGIIMGFTNNVRATNSISIGDSINYSSLVDADRVTIIGSDNSMSGDNNIIIGHLNGNDVDMSGVTIIGNNIEPKTAGTVHMDLATLASGSGTYYNMGYNPTNKDITYSTTVMV
jgi:hypothetical protein